MALVKEIELDATRSQVWDMVATGAGLSAWFVPHELESRLGGVGRAHFGGGNFQDGRVLIYEPGRRIMLGAEFDDAFRSEPEPFSGLEFWITGDSPTTLHVRQEGFPVVDQEVYESGWDVYLHTLSEYLRHFAPMPSATTVAIVSRSMERLRAYQRLVGALGVRKEVAVGEELTLQPRGRAGESISGVVDLRMSHPHLEVLGIRTQTGFLRAASDETCYAAALTRYEYVVDPERFRNLTAESASWQSWLEEQFAA
ncbi:SRPBCC family protein [Mycobacterium sp.]|uniref:SRPBCC family protein n=1 Tax=Mycobacterium sp. TaxID=1785 RepID=UPI002CD683D6|nr:SRPBCC domain-containing protein [Mycobacterium sp.]HTY35345.1 SRPBCC domain-containing protein [Mycobacterium sp.]